MMKGADMNMGKGENVFFTRSSVNWYSHYKSQARTIPTIQLSNTTEAYSLIKLNPTTDIPVPPGLLLLSSQQPRNEDSQDAQQLVNGF